MCHYLDFSCFASPKRKNSQRLQSSLAVNAGTSDKKKQSVLKVSKTLLRAVATLHKEARAASLGPGVSKPFAITSDLVPGPTNQPAFLEPL